MYFNEFYVWEKYAYFNVLCKWYELREEQHDRNTCIPSYSYVLSPSLSEQVAGRTKVTTAMKDSRQHGMIRLTM